MTLPLPLPLPLPLVTPSKPSVERLSAGGFPRSTGLVRPEHTHSLSLTLPGGLTSPGVVTSPGVSTI